MSAADVTGRELFEPLTPPYGGTPGAVKWSDTEAAILAAAADQIIPGGEGFPAPSEVRILDFIGKYVTPQGKEARNYPYAAEDDFKAALGRLGNDFVADASDARIERLKRVEAEDPTFFGQLRDLVYYGYYSRPEVTRAINENLEAGRDYVSPPQPYGYPGLIEEWDESLLARVKGDYIRTEDVKRVVVRNPATKG